MDSRRPPSKGGSSRPSSRPSSSRPSSSSSRPQSSSSDRPRSDRPTSDRPRSDSPRGGRPDRAGATRPSVRGQGSISPRTPLGRSNDPTRFRPRIFEPVIPDEVTGEELEKSARAELLSLSADNAKVVARHLVCVSIFIDTDPDRAYFPAR